MMTVPFVDSGQRPADKVRSPENMGIKKIILADVCLSNRLILLLRQHDITVFEAKRIDDSTARFTPRNAMRPYNDNDILEFVRRNEWMLITADRAFARRYEYAILVSANCKKSAEIQLHQALEQYSILKSGQILRRTRKSAQAVHDLTAQLTHQDGSLE